MWNWLRELLGVNDELRKLRADCRAEVDAALEVMWECGRRIKAIEDRNKEMERRGVAIASMLDKEIADARKIAKVRSNGKPVSRRQRHKKTRK